MKVRELEARGGSQSLLRDGREFIEGARARSLPTMVSFVAMLLETGVNSSLQVSTFAVKSFEAAELPSADNAARNLS